MTQREAADLIKREKDSNHLNPSPCICVWLSGRHRPPAVGGFFFCGVHLLPGRSTAAVGRPLRPHGVRVPWPYCGDPRLHHQQVPADETLEKHPDADWCTFSPLFTASL